MLSTTGRENILSEAETPYHHLRHECRCAKHPRSDTTIYRRQLLHVRSLLGISRPERYHGRLSRERGSGTPRSAIPKLWHHRHLIRCRRHAYARDFSVHDALRGGSVGSDESGQGRPLGFNILARSRPGRLWSVDSCA